MFQFGEIAVKIVHYYYISGRRLMLQSVVWWLWLLCGGVVVGEGGESVCWFLCGSFSCEISWRTLDVFGDLWLYII